MRAQWTKTILWALGVILLAALGALAYSGPTDWRLPEVRPSPSPYRVEVRFESEIPERYTVLSGPAQSYGWHRINDRFREELSEYAERKSSSSADAAVLNVTLQAVETDFYHLGAAPGAAGSIRLASGREPDGNSDVPELIEKTVRYRVRVEVEVGSRAVREETFTEGWTERIASDEFDWDRSYDYSRAIRGAVRVVINRIDAFLDQTLSGA